MNKKGFTVVELLASFSLTMIIVIFLFEIVIELKDVYVETAVKTDLQKTTAVITKNIKSAAVGVISVGYSDNKLTLNKSGGSVDITADVDNNLVQVGNRKFKMPDDTELDNYTFDSGCAGDNCYFKVRFVITSPKLTDPYVTYSVFYY